MKRLLFALSALALCLPAFGIDVDPKVDKAVRALSPVCADGKLTYEAFPAKLPTGFKSIVVKIESPNHVCDNQFVAITTQTGGVYLGMPWMIGGEEGKTIEEKLTTFTARNMQVMMKAEVDRKAGLSEDGLLRVTLTEMTEAGPQPIYGFADPQGQVFFMGSYRRLSGDLLDQRAKAFDAFAALAPTKGSSKAKVTILEFSDFQCPSCKRSSGFVDPILAKHPDAVRYVRFDLPLAMHPWAFPAALAGRAIYRQNPELFWQYKKDVYDNQGDLNAFMFWDWARNWASDHELDLAKYDADLNSAEIKKSLLDGAGTAFSNDIRATPTYMVNGALVEPGDGGKSLAAYVDQLLAK